MDLSAANGEFVASFLCGSHHLQPHSTNEFDLLYPQVTKYQTLKWQVLLNNSHLVSQHLLFKKVNSQWNQQPATKYSVSVHCPRDPISKYMMYQQPDFNTAGMQSLDQKSMLVSYVLKLKKFRKKPQLLQRIIIKYNCEIKEKTQEVLTSSWDWHFLQSQRDSLALSSTTYGPM